MKFCLYMTVPSNYVYTAGVALISFIKVNKDLHFSFVLCIDDTNLPVREEDLNAIKLIKNDTHFIFLKAKWKNFLWKTYVDNITNNTLELRRSLALIAKISAINLLKDFDFVYYTDTDINFIKKLDLSFILQQTDKNNIEIFAQRLSIASYNNFSKKANLIDKNLICSRDKCIASSSIIFTKNLLDHIDWANYFTFYHVKQIQELKNDNDEPPLLIALSKYDIKLCNIALDGYPLTAKRYEYFGEHFLGYNKIWSSSELQILFPSWVENYKQYIEKWGGGSWIF